MKILHFADRHGRDKDADEIEKCDAFIVETARKEKPDLIVNAGDTFDSADIKMGSRSALQAIAFHASLAGIAPVVVVKGTASHDGNAPTILRYVSGFNPVFVADTPVQVYLSGGSISIRPKAPIDAILTLIPQPTKQFFQTKSGIEAGDQEIGRAMSGLFMGFGAQSSVYPDIPHILVYHGCVSGGQASNGQAMTGRDITVSRDHLALSGADLILCGHLHLPQELPGSIFYSGSIYANNIGEDHKHGFYIHNLTETTAGRTNIWEFKDTPCKRTVRIQQDLTSPDCQSRTIDAEGVHVRIELTTWQDEAGKIDKTALEAFYKEQGALSVDIRITAIPRQNVRAESVLAATTLREEISEMAKLRGEEIEPDVLLKAELLENVPGEELMERIAGGAA